MTAICYFLYKEDDYIPDLYKLYVLVLYKWVAYVSMLLFSKKKNVSMLHTFHNSESAAYLTSSMLLLFSYSDSSRTGCTDRCMHLQTHVQYEVPKQNLYIRSAQLMHESGAQRSDWQFIEYHGCLFTKETMDKLHRGISVWHRLQVGLTYWGKHLPHARAGKHEVNASCRLARPVWLHQLKILRISLFRNKVLIFFAVVWSWYLVRETSGRRNGSLTGGALNVLRSLAKERMKSGILKRSTGIDWDSRVGYMSISNIRHIGSWSHRCHADFDLPKTAMPRLLL